jgi:hypothetical protein
MLVKALSKYLKEVEAAVSKLSSGYIERYEEECLAPDRVNLHIRVRFQRGQMLEWNEAVIGDEGRVIHLAYRYHFQDEGNKLVFRYDNTPHFPRLKAFPNHKHLPDDVIPANRPSVLEVFDEVSEALKL